MKSPTVQRPTPQSAVSRRFAVGLLIISLALVFGGSLLAFWVQTAGGQIGVRDVRFAGTNGVMMSGKLYLPDTATEETPAPAVLAIHGYINSNETHSPYAIEYARRGYVVVALDQTGHGYSDPPAFANGFGGPDGLRYLRSLSFIDPDAVVLEGHSMGGWASIIAASTFPEGYRSIVVSGSSTGTFGAPDGTPTFPRNFGLVFSQFDEFSELMWGSSTARGVVDTEKLQTVFGTDAPVEVGNLYGTVQEGTARQLYAPPVTHPGDHITRAGIGATIDWVQMTTTAPNPLPSSNQVWFWKETGTLLALIGSLLFLFGFGGVLLSASPFISLQQPVSEAKGAGGRGWWLAALLTAAIPTLTYFYFQNLGVGLLPASALFPQELTTGIIFWALANSAVSLVLFLVWHFSSARRSGATAASYGLRAPTGHTFALIGRSLLFAVVVVAGTYTLLAVCEWLFNTDFRFWVVALKLLSALQFRIFLIYVVPFTLFFVMVGVVLSGQLRRSQDAAHTGRAMWRNALVLVAGIAVLLAVQYIPLFLGAPLPFGEPLLTIIAHQFVVVLPLIALLSTYFFQKTGLVYPGAFIGALFVTWLIVASQATQFPL